MTKMPESEGHPTVGSLLEAERAHPLETEGSRPWRFIDHRHRDDHVHRHVLESRSERWHQLIDSELLATVRNTGRSTDPRSFNLLAVAYEATLGAVLDAALESGRNHARLVRFELAPPDPEGQMFSGLHAEFRSIVAWCPELKIRVIAGIPVSGHRAEAYRLLSGFRHDLRASAGRFDRRVRDRLLDRTHRGQERIVSMPASSDVVGDPATDPKARGLNPGGSRPAGEPA
ncbi:MAG: hypothetical protein CMJ23_08160 [Phycisphaerae bacterium]|nr:hypothetical protein [Phycisphaerae bacterium]